MVITYQVKVKHITMTDPSGDVSRDVSRAIETALRTIAGYYNLGNMYPDSFKIRVMSRDDALNA